MGSHISDLLLLLFLKLFPGLVESGRVFKAVPPLYGIPVGKKMQYFAERVDFVKYMQKEYYKKNIVTDLKGRKIESSVFSRLLIENSDYMYDFATIMNRKKVNPRLIELTLMSYLRKDNITKLKKTLTSEYRFLTNDDIIKMGDSIKIEGRMGSGIETLFYNDRFIEECKPIIPAIEKAMRENHMEFLVNGIKKGLYELVSDAMNSLSSVSRYKGLGEMDGDQLEESTMSPDTRTLVQYTVDDIDETMKIIRQYDSNKKKILDYLKTSSTIDRGDLIGL